MSRNCASVSKDIGDREAIGFLCGWPVGLVQFAAKLPERPGSQLRQFLQACTIRDVLVRGVLKVRLNDTTGCHTGRQTGLTTGLITGCIV